MLDFKNILKFLAVFFLSVAVYLIIFMIPLQRVEEEMSDYAKLKAGENASPEALKTAAEYYIDSISDSPILHLGFSSFGYEDLKHVQYALGINAENGCEIILQINPQDLIHSLSKESSDSNFIAALDAASKQVGGNFVKLFGEAYKKKAPNKKMARFFIGYEHFKVSPDASDAEVLSMLQAEIDKAGAQLSDLLSLRLAKDFSLCSYDKSTGYIRVVLPFEPDRRPRSLLTSYHELEFWEMFTTIELFGNLGDGPLLKLDKRLKSNKLFNGYLDSLRRDDIEKIAQSSLPQQSKDAILDSIASGNGPLFNIAGVWPAQDEHSPFLAYVKRQDTATLSMMLHSAEAKELLPSNIRFVWMNGTKKAENGEKYFSLLAIKVPESGRALLTGSAIAIAKPEKDLYGKYAISIEMNSAGARIWKKMTEQNLKKCIAITLGEEVIVYPRVNDVIPNGRISVSGDYTKKQATELAMVIGSRALLPAVPTVVSEKTIPATVSKDMLSRPRLVLVGIINLFTAVLLLLFTTKKQALNYIVLFAEITVFFVYLFNLGILSLWPLSAIAALLLIFIMMESSLVFFNTVAIKQREEQIIWKDALQHGLHELLSPQRFWSFALIGLCLWSIAYAMGPLLMLKVLLGLLAPAVILFLAVLIWLYILFNKQKEVVEM